MYIYKIAIITQIFIYSIIIFYNEQKYQYYYWWRHNPSVFCNAIVYQIIMIQINVVQCVKNSHLFV